MSGSWTERTINIAGTTTRLKRSAAESKRDDRRPMLVLHHDFGTPADLPFYDMLAASHDVLVPEHPGFGRSARPNWMRSVRDLAAVYRGLLAELQLEKPIIVGLGFGGWVAAEMATMAPRDVDRLVLVGPMGIRPDDGFILDQALLGYIDYVRAAFSEQSNFHAVFGDEPSSDQLEVWDICREMCFRIAWKPYMYSLTLPYLLKSVTAPTLLAWGRQDRVVPVSTLSQFAEALPHARQSIVDGCGHAMDMEHPDTLLELIDELCHAD